MTKEEIALKEQEAYEWMKSKGYDRRACKDIAPILVKYLYEETSKLHQPTVSDAICKHCGCERSKHTVLGMCLDRVKHFEVN